MNIQFLKDIDKGLSNQPKTLPSRYFYDKKGDQLFVDIMNMPEYYLTNAEHEIFKFQHNNIINALQLKKETPFELIELGAGDGYKTKELLNALVNENYHFSYQPIDISGHALQSLELSLKNEIPRLSVIPKQGDYFEVLGAMKNSNHPKVILFLGSNIGNLTDLEAHDLLYRLGSNLNLNDKLLIGVDLIKSENIILPAYNDSQGITAEFNLNLLERINRELNANFELNQFEHVPEYSEKEGIARSFLVSQKEQEVYIEALDKVYHFSEGEKIKTEISRKYDDSVLNKILLKTDFKIIGKFTDDKNYFADYILNKCI